MLMTDKVNQKLITLLLILGMASNYRLTLDNTLWSRLTPNCQFNNSVFDLSLNIVGFFIFFSSLAVKLTNLKRILKVNLTVVIISLAGLFIPGVRHSPLVYGILGASLGTFYFSYIFLMIYGLEARSRSQKIGLILFCVYLVKYLSDYFIFTYNADIALVMLLVIYLSMFYLLNRIEFRDIARNAPDETTAVPVAFIVLLGFIIFLSYFEVFLVGTDSKLLTILNQPEWQWLSQTVHLVICFAFFKLIKKVNYSYTLYFSLLSTIFAYIFSVLPFKTVSWLACLFYSITDTLGDIFLFNLLGEFIPRQAKRRLILSLIVLFMTLGVVGASFFVNMVNDNLADKSSVIYGSFLVLFTLTLFFIPFLNKQIDENVESLNPLKVLSSETSMLNHSLKNMVVQISCGIEILKKTQKEANQQVIETLDIMSNSVNQMMDIVKHININTEEISIVKAACNLEAIVDAAVKMIKLSLIDQQINFEKKVNGPADFVGDEKRIKEVVYNILKNACEALPGSGTILIELERNRNQLICRITDNGVGIPEAQQGMLFKPFFSTKKPETNNFGLGLTYCYLVMKEHKGKIEIKSEEKVGTSVCLIFPVQ